MKTRVEQTCNLATRWTRVSATVIPLRGVAQPQYWAEAEAKQRRKHHRNETRRPTTNFANNTPTTPTHELATRQRCRCKGCPVASNQTTEVPCSNVPQYPSANLILSSFLFPDGVSKEKLFGNPLGSEKITPCGHFCVVFNRVPPTRCYGSPTLTTHCNNVPTPCADWTIR